MVVHPAVPVTELPQGSGIEAELRDDGAVALRYRSRITSAEDVLGAVHAAGIFDPRRQDRGSGSGRCLPVADKDGVRGTSAR